MRPYFVIGIGSNVGSREAFLRAAELLLSSADGLRVAARSGLYLTEPVGPPQPRYLNAALKVETELDPLPMLDVVLAVEARLGRVRRERWGPRTVDLDLLAWSEGRFEDPRLDVPHPRLLERSFALAPLLDVAPELDQVVVAPFSRPASRPWTELPEADRFRIEALDPLDAWALGATAWTGAPVEIERIEPLRVAPGAPLPGCAWRAHHVLEPTGPDGLEGWRLIGRTSALHQGPAEVRLEPGGARFGPPKLL